MKVYRKISGSIFSTFCGSRSRQKLENATIEKTSVKKKISSKDQNLFKNTTCIVTAYK